MFGLGSNSTDLINNILGRVSEETLLRYYLNISEIPCLISCPYRKDDHPSFGIYYTASGNIGSRDFASGESIGDAFEILAKTWDTTLNTALVKIWADLIDGRVDTSKPIQDKQTQQHHRVAKMSNQSYLEVTVRDWMPHDVEYWQSFGISIDWLQLAEVYPISYVHIKNILGQKRIIPAEKYAYVYIERKDGIITKKIYQPFSERFKWRGNINKSVVSLWTKIPPTGDKVCICSSLKDALCLWANTKIPSIALQGEAYPISETAKQNLLSRYNKVYVCFDNDKPGILDAEKFTKETGFINIVLPRFEGGKDISDLYKSLNNKDLFRDILLKLFEEQ